MTAPKLFLAASLIGAAFTLTALLRGRRLSYLIVPYFFASWLTSELPLHHIVWQGAAVLVFAACGAMASWHGVVALVIAHISWICLIKVQRRTRAAATALSSALHDGFSGEHGPPPQIELDAHPWRPPLRPFHMRRPDVERVANIAYGEAGKRNELDIYRHRSHPSGCPTLLQIHGGGWVIGRKDQQGLPLMTHLAERGWVCIAPNYRLSPKATFPDHLVDIKRALAWIRTHGAEYGADPDFVVVTGGSAGGHLAAMVALTANDPEFQTGFEDVDTSVAACVPFYGVYDFLDRHGVRGRESMAPFLERLVMKCSPIDDHERWDNASPISHVHAGAPPFLILHGTNDSLAYVEDTRYFVQALRAVSRNPVLYAELPGTQHAFEIFHSVRCRLAVQAVECFIETVRARRADNAQQLAGVA